MILQRIKQTVFFSLSLLLISNEAMAYHRGYRHSRHTRYRHSYSNSAFPSAEYSAAPKSIQCLADVIAGEVGSNQYTREAKKNAAYAVLKRAVGQGQASSICAAAYARSQFAPRRHKVTSAILAIAREAAADFATMSAQSISLIGDYFHSYRNAYDRRAPWAPRFVYLGFDGAHHAFRNPRATVNTQLAALNMNSLRTDIGSRNYETSPTIMAENSIWMPSHVQL